ncbi:fungal-specific transcription factor domain-containing protein [Kalaharituber pfeilii]|nr:fungal-specific transcription factor domain-containing protein [Kalaharituber pfeilii]
MRPILPKQQARASSESSDHHSSSAMSAPRPKRAVVSNACVPCRKRRSKCNGQHPCAKCTSLERASECQFDAENDHRRKGALRRENEELKRKNLHLDAIFRTIASSKDDGQLESIVKRMRTGERFEDIANSIRATVGHLESHPERLSHSSSNDDAEQDSDPIESVSQLGALVRPSFWTNVTKDDNFIMELIDLYFTWHHHLFHFFSEHRFRADFAAGRLSNCSSLLVNAILATGCNYSDRPEARKDPNDKDSIGEHFSEEAKRIFDKGGKRTITTIQALPVMAVREAGMGRDLMGRWYFTLAYRLVRDPSYNELLIPAQLQKNEIDEEAWRITFWGCYQLETMWSFGLRRPSEENKEAERMLKPIPTAETENHPWVPFTGKVPKHALLPRRPSFMYTIIDELTSLCQITQEITHWLYGRKPFKAGTLLDFHARLRAWRDQLPEPIKEVRDDSIPGIFFLHEFHRVIVLALFRPFVDLPFEPSRNFLSPRELAGIASRELMQLLRKHGKAYGFRHANNMMFTFLIPLCNARQLEFPLPDAISDYMFGLKALKEMGRGWPFAKIALLSMVEIKDLPEEKKKPDKEVDSILESFQGLSIEKKTEMTQNSDYYVKIVENNPAGLAPGFEYHWRHEWARYVSGLVEENEPHWKTRLSIVKKPSVESLLN